jgi:hypothetical protein
MSALPPKADIESRTSDVRFIILDEAHDYADALDPIASASGPKDAPRRRTIEGLLSRRTMRRLDLGFSAAGVTALLLRYCVVEFSVVEE